MKIEEEPRATGKKTFTFQNVVHLNMKEMNFFTKVFHLMKPKMFWNWKVLF